MSFDRAREFEAAIIHRPGGADDSVQVIISAVTSGLGAVDLRPTSSLSMMDLTANLKLTGLKVNYTVQEGKQLVAREYRLPDGTRDFGVTRLRFKTFSPTVFCPFPLTRQTKKGASQRQQMVQKRVMEGPHVTGRLIPYLKTIFGTLPGME